MKLLSLLLLSVALTTQLCAAEPAVDDVSVNELQGMLVDIETELESRGVSIRDKQGRIEKAQSRMQRLVNRGSWKNAIIGSVLTAAVTAHPAGILVGGVAGSMVGKSKNYDRVEEKLAVIEREILLDEDDFLTEEEMRLAAFSGDITLKEEVHEEFEETGETMLVDIPEVNTNEVVDTFKKESPSNIQNTTVAASGQVAQFVASNVNGGSNHTQANTSAYENAYAQPSKPELESCYGRSVGDRKTRTQLPHCFYMMY